MDQESLQFFFDYVWDQSRDMFASAKDLVDYLLKENVEDTGMTGIELLSAGRVMGVIGTIEDLRYGSRN